MLSVLVRIGRDAELRYTPNGTAVCNVAMAYSHGRKGSDGQRPTQWIEVAVWGKQAEGLAPYFLKGKRFKVDIRNVHIETYQKRDGGDGHKLVGDLADIDFADDFSGSQNQNQDTQQQYQQAQQQTRNASQSQPVQQPANQGGHDFGGFDDDIPFSPIGLQEGRNFLHMI